MNDFQQYFSFESVVSALAVLRLRQASKRHQRQFYWDILENAPDPIEGEGIDYGGYLPPRRQWKRPRKANRRGEKNERIWHATIMRTVLGFRRSGRIEEVEWGQRLLGLVESIRRRVAEEHFSLQRPRIHFLHKGSGTDVRVIAEFESLEDRLILSQTAKYFRDFVDGMLLDVSYAFRKPRGSETPSHHMAIRALQEYQNDREGTKLYAAECDIAGFYDAIQHSVLRQAVAYFKQKREELGGTPIEVAALRVLKAYLDAYYYSDEEGLNPDIAVVLEEANNSETTGSRRVKAKGKLKRSGIPQGGAISPVLANMVLHAADVAVMGQQERDPELHYARFCDDMLLVHSSRKQCAGALKRYQEAVEFLNLPLHPVQRDIRYGKEYFKAKSKGPFLWGESVASRKGMPWISFVGYQLKYDGELRVRKSSLEKHLARQIREVSAITKHLKGSHANVLKLTPQKTYNRVKARLVSLGVGRSDVRQRAVMQEQPCWMDAFPLLEEAPFVMRQLRALDRNRERQLARLRKQLCAYFKQQGEEVQIRKHSYEYFVKHPELAKKLGIYFSDGSISYVGRLRRRIPFALRLKEAPQSIRGYGA